MSDIIYKGHILQPIGNDILIYANAYSPMEKDTNCIKKAIEYIDNKEREST